MDFRKIKAVIFDFDGVIADTAADIARSTNAALEHFGYRTLSQEQIILFVGGGADQLLRRSIDASLELSPPAMLTGQPPFGEVYEWYVNYYRQHCVEGTELYPGVQSLLELLCIQEISCAIVSNKPHTITDAILGRMGLHQYFASVIGPEQTSHLKPDPEGLLLALRHINEGRMKQGKSEIFPEEVLMVGDSHTDIEAGQNAGTKTCAITGGYGDKDRLTVSGADITVQRTCELIAHLQRAQQSHRIEA